MDLGGTVNFNANKNTTNQNLNDFDSSFSVLDRYGTYVTNEEYITDPAIGRDEQIKQLILVLLTPEKSAILIGKPGIGKTAIVEGLAYRIQKNNVPDALMGYQIINIKTASLLGTMPNGETKVQKMIDELKTKDKLILFIDEIHMLIGSTESSSLDFANIFKEGLGRGSIKVIGATTTEEYERYILRDKAFTRRFQKIDVPEPTRDETIKIMMGTLPKFEKQTGRKMKYTRFIQERIMTFIVDITSEYKRIFALGSRYPDVCLTLLKQAFSYTVYDNRPYMDIFDVRKAIENSKNIYPDVIKKELPNFDKMFNDIMLEEKGEKPVEEWRKDNTPTRNELENNNINNNNDVSVNNGINNNQNNISNLRKVPEMTNNSIIKKNNSLIDSRERKKGATIGTISVPVSIKKKLNSTSNVGALDDILLSSNVSVLKNDEKSNELVFNYEVTDEIRNGVTDDYLFSRPILSTIENNNDKDEEKQISKYRLGKKKKEGRKMWNNNNGNGGFDISNQNFDKYQNFFHQNNMENNSYNDDQDRMNMLMGNNNNFGNYGPNNNGLNPMDPYNNQFQNGYPMNQPYNGNMPNQESGMNMNYMPPNNDMYNQFGVNNQNMGMNNQPMYDNQMGNSFGGYNPNPNGFNNMGVPMNNNSFGFIDNQNNNGGESIFGAPMYSTNDDTNKKDNKNDDLPDIYERLQTNDMQIKNGEIVSEFPTFDKLNNLSNITASMNQNATQGPMNNGFLPQDNMMFNQPMMGPNNGNYNQGGFGINQMMPGQDMNQNRNWVYVDNQNNFGLNNNQPSMQNQPTLFQKNILDEVPKKQNENNISSKENVASPSNNKDYYEDMKNGDFVNFSDLNKGNVKEEDTNKYMGVQVNQNKPQFDLNLENNSEEEKYDDFYE